MKEFRQECVKYFQLNILYIAEENGPQLCQYIYTYLREYDTVNQRKHNDAFVLNQTIF